LSNHVLAIFASFPTAETVGKKPTIEAAAKKMKAAKTFLTRHYLFGAVASFSRQILPLSLSRFP